MDGTDKRRRKWVEAADTSKASRLALRLAQHHFNGDGLPRRALRVVRIKEEGTIDART